MMPPYASFTNFRNVWHAGWRACESGWSVLVAAHHIGGCII